VISKILLTCNMMLCAKRKELDLEMMRNERFCVKGEDLEDLMPVINVKRNLFFLDLEKNPMFQFFFPIFLKNKITFLFCKLG
jgi:hypothetical protein